VAAEAGAGDTRVVGEGASVGETSFGFTTVVLAKPAPGSRFRRRQPQVGGFSAKNSIHASAFRPDFARRDPEKRAGLHNRRAMACADAAGMLRS
jgi:hypothetical protein